MGKVIPTNGTSAEDIKYANTVKKVYIDGVDVSGCEQYRAEIETEMPYGEYEIQKDKCHYSGIEIIQDCKGIKGCIYKQLQRLKAENEQLKKSIDRIMQNKEIKTIDSEIALLNAELQQENKRLKARLRPLEDSYFKGLSSIEIAELAKKSIRITAENRKLEDALQEIKELIKKLDLSLGCAYGDYDCDNCSDINEETVCKIKLQNIIIDKINEIIEE